MAPILPDRSSLIGRWKPGGYLAQALRMRPVPGELWTFMPLPADFHRFGLGGSAPIEISHRWERHVPTTPPPPEPDWISISDDDIADVVERHNAELAAWRQANPIKEHRFTALLADFMWAPRCPACGFSALPVVPESHDIHTERLAYRAVVQSWGDKAIRTFVQSGHIAPRQVIQLDHIFPLVRAVELGIPEEVTASPVNLQLLRTRDNLSKGSKPGMSVDELLDRYLAWLAEHPDWLDLLAHRRATGSWPRMLRGQVIGRYANTDERDTAHRRRMAPAYTLWQRGYDKHEIAEILGLSASTLSGRIQLDKRYCGADSVFRQTFARAPLEPGEIAALAAEHRRLHDDEQRARAQRREGTQHLPLAMPLDQAAARRAGAPGVAGDDT